MKRGLLIVISGPSGVGKGTVVKELFKTAAGDLAYSISATTRERRPGEVDGKDYFFLTEAEFFDRIKAGAFLEQAEFIGNYYGTPAAEVEKLRAAGKDVLLEIDTAGAEQVRAKCPEALTIFLVPPSLEELKARLAGRGTEPRAIIDRRIAKASREISLAPLYDFTVVNDSVARAAAEIRAIIQKTKGEQS